MKMSLDEAIKHVEELTESSKLKALSYAHLEKFHKELSYNSEAQFCKLSKEECELKAAQCSQIAEWLRKYQKIQEIMKKEYRAADMSQCLVERLVEIREVVEDGNDD